MQRKRSSPLRQISPRVREERRELALASSTLTYTLRRSPRARALRLAVFPDGRVVLTVPPRLSDVYAEKFLHEKVDWLLAKRALFEKVGEGRRHLTRRDYLRHKGRARALARARIAHFAVRCGVSHSRLAIKDLKTRWGSCSEKGNLNFSYKIALLPERLCDYVIVHELCHLKEFNHSEKFWSLVASVLPDYKTLRKELRAQGALLA